MLLDAAWCCITDMQEQPGDIAVIIKMVLTLLRIFLPLLSYSGWQKQQNATRGTASQLSTESGHIVRASFAPNIRQMPLCSGIAAS
jgi:hypothetical protein